MHIYLHVCNRVTRKKLVVVTYEQNSEMCKNHLKINYVLHLEACLGEKLVRERQEKGFTAIYIYVKVAMRKMEMKYVAKADTIDAEK